MKHIFRILLAMCTIMAAAHLAHGYYDPTPGRWLSMDPIDQPKSTSGYEYCGNDPVNKFDPDGRQEFMLFAEEPFVLRPVLETARPLETVRPVDDPIQAHHADPKFMGGDPNQPLTDLLRSSHQDLHNSMNKFLEQYTDEDGNNMRPTSDNSGQEIRNNFPRAERLDALKDFYSGIGSQWPDAAQSFFDQHPELLPLQVLSPAYYVLKKPCPN